MTKNLTNFEDFREKKSINESKKEEKVNEGQLLGDVMRVPMMVDVPLSLLKAYATKVKNETGQDIKNGSIWSDSLLSDEIAKYVIANFMNIENIPVTLATGDAGGKKIQGQGQGQAQVVPQPQSQVPQGQPPVQQPTQPVQVAPAPAQTQVPPATGGGQPSPQQTAQQIPATEQ